ncbi:MAG: antibiotic biosynthesis monooxygenase family protein [Acetobacteraceae bacterium]
MFVVIFEVQPRADRWDAYLAHASALKPELERIDGFLDNERFASRARPGWLVSLSTWRDEKALIRWRTQEHHHAVQVAGRTKVFQDYRLRVGEVAADSQPPPGLALVEQRRDATVTGEAKAALLVEAPQAVLDAIPANAAAAPLAGDRFDSIPNPGKGLTLSFWLDPDTAAANAPGGPEIGRWRVVRIIRDYGMFERAEAPQYYPPAARA